MLMKNSLVKNVCTFLMKIYIMSLDSHQKIIQVDFPHRKKEVPHKRERKRWKNFTGQMAKSMLSTIDKLFWKLMEKLLELGRNSGCKFFWLEKKVWKEKA